jgi:fused
LINLIKSIGIFANQASLNPLRSYLLYRELIDVKFINDSIALFKTMENALTLLKYVVQVLAVLNHPIYGEIFTFPWKRAASSSVYEFNEVLPIFECVR